MSGGDLIMRLIGDTGRMQRSLVDAQRQFDLTGVAALNTGRQTQKGMNQAERAIGGMQRRSRVLGNTMTQLAFGFEDFMSQIQNGWAPAIRGAGNNISFAVSGISVWAGVITTLALPALGYMVGRLEDANKEMDKLSNQKAPTLKELGIDPQGLAGGERDPAVIEHRVSQIRDVEKAQNALNSAQQKFNELEVAQERRNPVLDRMVRRERAAKILHGQMEREIELVEGLRRARTRLLHVQQRIRIDSQDRNEVQPLRENRRRRLLEAQQEELELQQRIRDMEAERARFPDRVRTDPTLEALRLQDPTANEGFVGLRSNEVAKFKTLREEATEANREIAALQVKMTALNRVLGGLQGERLMNVIDTVRASAQVERLDLGEFISFEGTFGDKLRRTIERSGFGETLGEEAVTGIEGVSDLLGRTLHGILTERVSVPDQGPMLGIENLQELLRDAERFRDTLTTPFDTFIAETERINTLFEKGFFSEEERDRLFTDAEEKFDKARGKSSAERDPFVGEAFGSEAAARSILEAMTGGNDPEDPSIPLLERIAAATERSSDEGKRSNTGIDQPPWQDGSRNFTQLSGAAPGPRAAGPAFGDDRGVVNDQP